MNLSTRFKFTLLVFGALGLLAVATGIFTGWRVREAVSEKLWENSANAVALSAAMADDVHKSLFLRKVDQAMGIKAANSLWEKTILAFSGGGDDFFPALRRIALAKGSSILVADEGLNVVFRHGDFPDGFNPYRTNDIKGREVGPTMLRLAREGVLAAALVRRDAAGGMAMKFFGQHFYLENRKLLVGLWTDIAAQREEEQHELDKAVATLADTFGGIRLGSSGFLMAVDGAGALAIASRTAGPRPDMAETNPVSGRTFFDDVRLADESPGKSFYAEASWLGKGRRAIVFVRQVRAMGWYVIGVGFADEIEATGRRLALSLALAILAISAGLTLAAALMVGKLTAPLTRLAEFARQVSKTDFLREAGNGIVDGLATRPSRDEIGELARALLFMDGELRARVRDLVETTGKRERMEGELHAAARIQTGFLPGQMPEAAAGRVFLAARLIPAREVGGDLYDFFMLDENRLCVVIGDVSDKGVSAALFMSMTMILLHSGGEAGFEPELMLRRINRNLARDNANEMFVTLFVAVADLRNGELRYANGGHNPPYVVSPSGARRLEDASGPLVGAFGDAAYSGGKTVLAPGETLFLYTDGVTEAMNAANREFGEAALERHILACREDAPETVIERVHAAVLAHTAGAPASDDLTMLCLRLK